MGTYLSSYFIFVWIIFRVHSHDDIHCQHDKVEQHLEFLDVDEALPPVDNEGRLLASEFPNIRIYPYYELLNTAPVSYKSYIQNDLAPPVIDYFQAALKVKFPILGMLIIPSRVKTLCGDPVPAILYNGVETDFFYSIDSKLDTASNWAGASYFCYLSTVMKRPFILKTVLNRNIIKHPQGDVLVHEKNTYSLMHEMTHNLGFSQGLYPYYLDESGQPRQNHIKHITLFGSQHLVIDVPSLTLRLRRFFGCPNLEGAYMEDDGGTGTSGSHFERRYFLYETMTSGTMIGRRFSEFSLGMIEATGWYIPDYKYAEPYFFGQGQGCGFVKSSCTTSNNNFEEFCKDSSRGCAAHGRGGGFCTTDSNSDGCRYFFPTSDYDCENLGAEKFTQLPDLQVFGRGTGSRCFEGTLTTSKTASKTNFCFRFSCEGTGVSRVLKVKVGNQNIVCQKEGPMKVDGYNGVIECPDPLFFCLTVGKPYCPRNCMGRGKCVNNKCLCQEGSTGIDCSLKA